MLRTNFSNDTNQQSNSEDIAMISDIINEHLLSFLNDRKPDENQPNQIAKDQDLLQKRNFNEVLAELHSNDNKSNKSSHMSRKLEKIHSEGWSNKQLRFQDLDLKPSLSKLEILKKNSQKQGSTNYPITVVAYQTCKKVLNTDERFEKNYAPFMSDAIKRYSRVEHEKFRFRKNTHGFNSQGNENENRINEQSTLKKLACDINSIGFSLGGGCLLNKSGNSLKTDNCISANVIKFEKDQSRNVFKERGDVSNKKVLNNGFQGGLGETLSASAKHESRIEKERREFLEKLEKEKLAKQNQSLVHLNTGEERKVDYKDWNLNYHESLCVFFFINKK